MAGVEWKDKGNASLKAGNVAEAIEHYTKAITPLQGSGLFYFILFIDIENSGFTQVTTLRLITLYTRA